MYSVRCDDFRPAEEKIKYARALDFGRKSAIKGIRDVENRRITKCVLKLQ